MKKLVIAAANSLSAKCVKESAWMGVSSEVQTSEGLVEICAKMVVNNTSRFGTGANFARLTYKLNGQRVTVAALHKLLA
jgi:hypothetical protein